MLTISYTFRFSKVDTSHNSLYVTVVLNQNKPNRYKSMIVVYAKLKKE